MNNFLKIYKFNNYCGTALILVFGIIRFWLVLWGYSHNNYNLVLILFLFMWTLPWLLLDRSGRIRCRITKPSNYIFLAKSIIAGFIASLFVFYLGSYLYQNTNNNWFVYMAIPFKQIDSTQPSIKLTAYLVSTLIGMTLSPVGEEFLYRGLVHEAFASKTGDKTASLIDSLAFALTHLAHFGILYLNGTWTFVFVPAILWVLLMFALCQLFFSLKSRAGSIWAAVCCHAGFNLGMIYFIFYHVF